MTAAGHPGPGDGAVLVGEAGPGGASRLDFALPPGLEATEPPEERGQSRDGVRLLVARRGDGSVEHHRFTDLPTILDRGDLLLVNTSATLPAAVEGRLDSARPATVHLSGSLPAGLRVVELRHPGRDGAATTPWFDVAAGTVVHLPDRARITLLHPAATLRSGGTRLWVARVEIPGDLLDFLARRGRPIRYGYVHHDRPIGAYQTIFADEPGSAEMPSAARPFSAELVARLATRGVVIAPFVLHAGVSSPEVHEPPAPEWYRVPAETADLVNVTRRAGHRVVGVGTTAVRALETITDARGRSHPGEGWTDVVITPERGVRAVDGLITGWHEPEASHLAMLEAVAGYCLLRASYKSALEAGYLWHEFGDSHLILR